MHPETLPTVHTLQNTGKKDWLMENRLYSPLSHSSLRL